MAAPIGLTGSVFLDCATLAAVLYIGWSVQTYWKLRHIPGPTLWGWTIYPLFRLHLSGNQYHGFRDLSKKYGKIVRIAPTTVLVSDANVMRRMSAPRSRFTRADFYVAFRLAPGKDNVFSQRDEKIHEDLRRKMAAGYSGKEIPTLEPDIDECVQELITLLDTKYVGTGPDRIFDMSQKIQFFTTDTITKLAFDFKFNDLRDDHDNYGYLEQVTQTFLAIYGVVTIPAVLDLLTNIGFMSFFSPSLHDEFGLGKVFSITRKQVVRRFDAQGKENAETKRNDILGSFIKHGLDQDQAEQESLVQLAAGSDTTATAIRTTLLCVMSNPRVYAKVVAEIDSAKESGKVTSTTNGTNIIPNEEAKELVYLQACIKEGLRWLPPTTAMISKKTPPEGAEICGYHIPGNISVANSNGDINRNPDLFGPDEEAYRPERWILTSDGGDETFPEKLKALERNNELIFGSGRFQCLGKNVAAIELNKVLFELFARFQFTLVNPAKGLTSFAAGIWLQKDFWVTVRRRT